MIAIALLLLSPCTRGPPLAKAMEYLEPNVRRHVGVLPPSVCKQLIDLGEKSGFLVMEVEESIDEDDSNDDGDNPSKKVIPAQQIDIYDKGTHPSDAEYHNDNDNVGIETIENESIYNVLQSWIPTITDIVKTKRHNEEEFNEYHTNKELPYKAKEPDLNWIFFRKYSPNTERNSLSLHHDTNRNTVTIELNDDYVGGGFFYLKPLANTTAGEEEMDDDIRSDYYERDWVESLKRANTSDIIFPDLHTGDAVFYNYTVHHGIAPIQSGTRYSMVFFFDMDNPAVREDFEDDDDGVNNSQDEGGFTVELHNDLPDMKLNWVLVYDAAEKKKVREIQSGQMAPGGASIYHAHDGDILVALVEGTEETVSKIEIRRDQSVYKANEMGFSPKSKGVAFDVELHNGLPDIALDLALVYDAAREKGVWDVFDKVTPGESTRYYAYEGDRLWAMIESTDEAVSEIEIRRNQSLYTISEIEYLLSPEL